MSAYKNKWKAGRVAAINYMPISFTCSDNIISSGCNKQMADMYFAGNISRKCKYAIAVSSHIFTHPDHLQIHTTQHLKTTRALNCRTRKFFKQQ